MNTARPILYPVILVLVVGGLFAWQRYRQALGNESLDVWLKRVDHANVGTRIQAAQKLGQLGRDSDEAWTALVNMSVRDEDSEVQYAAIASLKALCQPPELTTDARRLERKRAAIRSLLEALEDPNDDVRTNAPVPLYTAAGLEYHERAVKRVNDDEVDREMRPLVVNALILALSDDCVDVRDEALRCLLSLDRLSPRAEAPLLAELGQSNAETRAAAVKALAKVDTLSDDGIAGLVFAAQDKDAEVRSAALAAISQVGPRAVAAVRTELAKVDADRREHLRDVLRALGEDPDKK